LSAAKQSDLVRQISRFLLGDEIQEIEPIGSSMSVQPATYRIKERPQRQRLCCLHGADATASLASHRICHSLDAMPERVLVAIERIRPRAARP
jgi:hypothetical protein